MNKTEYLSQVKQLDKLINTKLDTIAELRVLAVKSTGIISATPVQPGKKSRLEEVICKIADLEAEVNEDISRLIDKKREVAKTISTLNNPNQEIVLEMRYLQGKGINQIAAELDKSIRWVYDQHRTGIKKIILPEY